MCENFWKGFYDVKVAAYYYQLYAVSSSHWNRIISIGCAIASTFFIASAFISNNFPIMSAIITVLFQIVLAIQPFLPFTVRKQAANYIFQDMNKLTNEMESTWNSIKKTELTAEEIDESVKSYLLQRDQIEERFADCDTFPSNRLLHKIAEKRASQYFRRFEDAG